MTGLPFGLPAIGASTLTARETGWDDAEGISRDRRPPRPPMVHGTYGTMNPQDPAVPEACFRDIGPVADARQKGFAWAALRLCWFIFTLIPVRIRGIGEAIMKILQICALGAAVTLVAACQSTNDETAGAVTGAALGTGVGLVTGGSFGQVVGAGLIGGAAGYIVGDLAGDN